MTLTIEEKENESGGTSTEMEKSSLPMMTPNSSSWTKSFNSEEMKNKIDAITERWVKHIKNNEAKEIEIELNALPEAIGVDDLKNNDGLTLLHMACFKNQ